MHSLRCEVAYLVSRTMSQARKAADRIDSDNALVVFRIVDSDIQL